MFNLKKFKNKTAIIGENGKHYSYGQVEELSCEISSGIRNRSLVFVLCENVPESIIGYISIMNSGSVPVLLGAGIDGALLENLIRIYRPEYYWAPVQYSKEMERRKAEKIYSFGIYCLYHSYESSVYPLNPNLNLLLTTSGSTGSPKFVRQSYDNVLSNARAIKEYLELDCAERPITTLPMNYTYGLSIINSHLLVGATILVIDKGLLQKEFWQFFREQGATSFGGVPYTYEMLDKLRFYHMELPTLRTMTQAGGKLTVELHEKFANYAKDHNKRFIVMYGQCEATARMGYLPADKAVEKKGSMGISIPGGKFKLMGVDGSEIITPHTTGELIYVGPNVTLGYAERGEDLIKGDERNGVLATGDMAQFDEDGYYYIVGRKKRFLKIYGNRVNLDEMDRLIKGRYGIEAACAGVDDQLYIFLTDAKYADEIKKFAAKTTKLNPVAFKTVVLDKIPKNDSGKVQYKELQKYYV